VKKVVFFVISCSKRSAGSFAAGSGRSMVRKIIVFADHGSKSDILSRFLSKITGLTPIGLNSQPTAVY
jgi:hypothetical protein